MAKRLWVPFLAVIVWTVIWVAIGVAVDFAGLPSILWGIIGGIPGAFIWIRLDDSIKYRNVCPSKDRNYGFRCIHSRHHTTPVWAEHPVLLGGKIDGSDDTVNTVVVHESKFGNLWTADGWASFSGLVWRRNGETAYGRHVITRPGPPWTS